MNPNFGNLDDHRLDDHRLGSCPIGEESSRRRRARRAVTNQTWQPAASLLLALALCGSLSAMADGGHRAHYLVFEIDSDGLAVPLFHRLVELGSQPESMAETEFSAARSGIRDGEPLIAFELRDVDGEVTFRSAVRFDPWLRGEFHGAEQPGGGWHIERYHIPHQRRLFVVLAPRLPSTRLVLDGATRSIFDLDLLARDAARLPLAYLSGKRQQTGLISRGGDPGNRVDLLIMGDGYTSAAEFDAEAATLASDFLAISPYSVYANYVNVVTLHTPSAQNGADHPPYDPGCVAGDSSCCADPAALSDPLAGTYVDTAFDGRYCVSNIHRLAVVDSAAVLAAASAVPDWDHILVLLNDDTYGGSGGFLAVTSTHPSAADIARHEYGHSFTGLADEYDLPFPGFPSCSDVTSPSCEPNVTDETSPALIKWAPWIDEGTPIPTPENDPLYAEAVGLFEGARYRATGMYRPRDFCLMRSLGVSFGEICAQTYVLKLYQGGWGMPAAGIDPIEPGSEEPPPGAVETEDPVSLSVALLAPVGGPALDIGWWVDGVPQSGAIGDTFVFAPPAPGSYQVELRVEDETPLVHPAMAGSALQSQRTWLVTCSGSCSEIFVDGFESGDTSAWLAVPQSR